MQDCFVLSQSLLVDYTWNLTQWAYLITKPHSITTPNDNLFLLFQVVQDMIRLKCTFIQEESILQISWFSSSSTGSSHNHLNYHATVCFPATNQFIFSYSKVNVGSLMWATILVHTLHMKARQALSSLQKCWLGRSGKWSFTLSQPGSNPQKLFSLDHHTAH